MRCIDVEQGSEAWQALRNRPTASDFDRIITMEALTVYRWAVRQVAQGCDVVAISGDHRTTIETPGLSVAREKGERGRGLAAERLGLTE